MIELTSPMLAHNYTRNDNVDGWFVSEKLDGMRAIWIPETRGKKKKEIPWANKTNPEHICSGLWSRLRNIIFAPNRFLDKLPEVYLDGELYIGRNRRQDLMSIVKKHIPTIGWKSVKYWVFDTPDNGDIIRPFRETVKYLEKLQYTHGIDVLVQRRMNLREIHEELNIVSSGGGEGLILRNPNSIWRPGRSHNLLKMKKLDDAEANVIGFTSGRGKHRGRLGALIVRYKGDVLKLSGMTDDERGLEDEDVKTAWDNPGAVLKINKTKHFTVGQQVTFQYRGLSQHGIPQEARYYREV